MFVIKCNNFYICIVILKFRFLDMNQYFVVGILYFKFFKVYGVEEEKGFFLYEWFDLIDKLDDIKFFLMGDDWFLFIK